MAIYITGIGIVSAIGIGHVENLSSLLQERTGLLKSPVHGLFEGKVKLSDEEIIHQFNLEGNQYSRTTLLSLCAITEAWSKNSAHCKIKSGIVNGTSVGGLDKMELHYREFKKHKEGNYLSKMIYDNGYSTSLISEYLGIYDYVNTLSTACSTGANAILLGARLIENKILDRVLVGSCDPLTEFNRRGFESLKIYDPAICKPFDKQRMGLNLGEGSAFLLLENEKSLNLTGNSPIARISGWHNAADNYHQTASSPEGTGSQLTMKGALKKARLQANEISYINAHGTGTSNNDLSESIAIDKVFKEHTPPLSSTKGFTGHTLAAAGCIEAVFCVLSIIHDVLFSNLNLNEPMNEVSQHVIQKTVYNAAVQHTMTNSFGFGGNCTSLIFSKL